MRFLLQMAPKRPSATEPDVGSEWRNKISLCRTAPRLSYPHAGRLIEKMKGGGIDGETKLLTGFDGASTLNDH